jgi:hypothetical protein
MLRVTARHADAWSAFGGLALDDKAACFAALREQARVIDSECEAIDREPSTLRRSLLAFRPLTPWTSAGALDEIVEFARELRFDEVVVYKPTTDEELDVFEDAVARFPSLRAG